MAEFYADRIRRGKTTLDKVPASLVDAVKAILGIEDEDE